VYVLLGILDKQCLFWSSEQVVVIKLVPVLNLYVDVILLSLLLLYYYCKD